jgi:hypothetical protein
MRAVHWRVPLSLFALLTAVALFLGMDISQPVWQTFSGLFGFLQFPWRFMTLAALGVSMASIFVAEWRPWLTLLILPSLIFTSMANLPIHPAPYPDSDAQAMLRFEFRSKHIGSTYSDEYLPWWVTMDPVGIPRPDPAPKPDTVLPEVRLQLPDAGYTNRRFSIATDSPFRLRLHQFFMPVWRATLDGRPLPTYPSTALGL